MYRALDLMADNLMTAVIIGCGILFLVMYVWITCEKKKKSRESAAQQRAYDWSIDLENLTLMISRDIPQCAMVKHLLIIAGENPLTNGDWGKASKNILQRAHFGKTQCAARSENILEIELHEAYTFFIETLRQCSVCVRSSKKECYFIADSETLVQKYFSGIREQGEF